MHCHGGIQGEDEKGSILPPFLEAGGNGILGYTRAGCTLTGTVTVKFTRNRSKN
jgi:hypothetical protein